MKFLVMKRRSFLEGNIMENNRIVERLIRYYPASTIANDIISELIKKDGEISISASRIKLLEGQVKQLREALTIIHTESLYTGQLAFDSYAFRLRSKAHEALESTKWPTTCPPAK